MNWFRKLFAPRVERQRQSTLLGVVMPPVDNPLDYRPDGSIREGDPAYEAMMRVLDSGKSTIFTQNDDGSWNGEELDDLENTQPTDREADDV